MLLLVGLNPLAVQAQVGVGTTTPDASAALHVSATNKGVLFPQVNLASLTDAAAVPSPAPSVLVFNTNAALSGGVGFYYNAGTAAAPAWTRLNTGTTPAGANWNLTGNAATDPTVNYLGTTDRQPLVLRTQGTEKARLGLNGAWWLGGAPIGSPTYPDNNVLMGYQAGNALATADINNQFVGYQAGFNSTSSFNQFTGFQAGYSTTNGTDNYFSGMRAGYANTTGNYNHFVGYQAGLASTTASGNHFEGYRAGQSTTTGDKNHFVGYTAGMANTTGRENSFSGHESGRSNTTGSRNVFSGRSTGYANTSGDDNVFAGTNSGTSNTSGDNNAFLGAGSGHDNTTGNRNTYLGFNAGYHLRGTDNVTLGNAAGSGDVSSSVILLADQVTLVGSQAGQKNTADGTVAIGYQAGLNNTTGLGNQFVGYQAGLANTTGNENYASGYRAGLRLSSGDNNSLVGNLAGTSVSTGSYNTALGYNAASTLTTGSRNTLLGYDADVNSAGLSYAAAIGAGATVGASNALALGGSTSTTQVRVGIGTATPNSRLSLTPSLAEPKITLFDNGSTSAHYGFGVSTGQLNYHVSSSSGSHVFYAGGKNGDGTELLSITGNGEVQKPATGDANLLPIAYGRVVGNTSSTYPQAIITANTISGEVDIQFLGALAGRNLGNATVIVTCITTGRIAVAHGASSGHIIVNISNAATNAGAAGDFQFVVYQP
ncbi:hypothetical protein J0X19_06660 [Hymenobacter sp. BT186]|uniref:Trimeric autotransporter adhesin YadA-like head domain-containing protein n=1 Tax=Hymenobacter telluris TaxID=2816474 RepID=A0A939EVX7_9BACT|nr:hypothetical protein [Hymenobacter telluris]MBO0357620.1 hypothetical protein [Hymenobacter telluris]MBW3373646.1 hypothetical protein [Hymenobacter norwichensis]